jgi:uncharacterized membrane protein
MTNERADTDGSGEEAMQAESHSLEETTHEPTHIAGELDEAQEEEFIAAMFFQGPLPPPAVLRSYNDIIPGAAQDMHNLALEKARHEMEMDKQHARTFRRAQWLTFFLALFLIVCGTTIILAGYAWAGATIITADLVGLVLAFLYGRRSESDSSESG